MLKLVMTGRTDEKLLECMSRHYTQPKGFVGRNICFAIYWNKTYYGHIVAGSAPKWVPGRNDFLGMTCDHDLQRVIDNIFFHVEKVDGKYPVRNFVPKIIAEWRRLSAYWWNIKYSNRVIGFQSLVELPRTGECYIRDRWTLVGQTKGFTCKRPAGIGSDTWSGRREWDRENLRPKLVFCRRI